MPLHPQDVVVILKVVANRDRIKRFTYAEFGKDILMSASQVFRSVERAESANLLRSVPAIPSVPGIRVDSGLNWMFPHNGNIKEFLIHGVKYSFRGARRSDSWNPHGGSGSAPEPDRRSGFSISACVAGSSRVGSWHRIFALSQNRPASGEEGPRTLPTPRTSRRHSRRTSP